MLSAINYIHSKGFSHRDLKPHNILIDNQFNLKIADFGLTAETQGRNLQGYLTTCCGTQAFMAPEILKEQPYKGEVVDLFALGITLFWIYSGNPPFSMATDEDYYYGFIAREELNKFW